MFNNRNYYVNNDNYSNSQSSSTDFYSTSGLSRQNDTQQQQQQQQITNNYINGIEGTQNLVATSSQQTNYIHVNSIHQHHHHYHLHANDQQNLIDANSVYYHIPDTDNKSVYETYLANQTNLQQQKIDSPPSSILNDIIDSTDDIIDNNNSLDKSTNDNYQLYQQQQQQNYDLNENFNTYGYDNNNHDLVMQIDQNLMFNLTQEIDNNKLKNENTYTSQHFKST
jgi:hypothetical protein